MDDVPRGIHLLQHGDAKGSCLAGAVLGAGEHVAPHQRDGYALLLDGRRLFKALLKDAHQQLALQEVVLEIIALGGSHICMCAV